MRLSGNRLKIGVACVAFTSNWSLIVKPEFESECKSNVVNFLLSLYGHKNKLEISKKTRFSLEQGFPTYFVELPVLFFVETQTHALLKIYIHIFVSYSYLKNTYIQFSNPLWQWFLKIGCWRDTKLNITKFVDPKLSTRDPKPTCWETLLYGPGCP